MEKYYSVSEYAKLTGKDPGNIRRMLISGRITGEKMGNQWFIPKDAVCPEDKRVKSGVYRNWRKQSAVRHANPGLMAALSKMCGEIGKLYGSDLERVVLYGSYARGEQTPESDVDIAMLVKKDASPELHDAITDIVVDYELEQGVTLSVITIERENYCEWNKMLPFYKNIEKEGIVIWKTA